MQKKMQKKWACPPCALCHPPLSNNIQSKIHQNKLKMIWLPPRVCKNHSLSKGLVGDHGHAISFVFLKQKQPQSFIQKVSLDIHVDPYKIQAFWTLINDNVWKIHLSIQKNNKSCIMA